MSAPFVDIPAVANIMEIDTTELRIEFVEHSVIPHSQLELRPALQSLVREQPESSAHLIQLPLHIDTNGRGQAVERGRKGARPDLERSGHGSLNFACGVLAPGDFTARLLDLGLYIVGQFKLILHVINQPSVEPFKLRPREIRNGSLNFLNCAHEGNVGQSASLEKSRFIRKRH